MTSDTLRALRAGFTFLTRLPAPGADESDWESFDRTPSTFPVVGAVVGALAALPLFVAGTLPGPTVALGYLVGIYLLTGIHHVDGVADVGDAIVVHGDRERRRTVLKDTTTGVGAVLAVCLVVAGLFLGGLALSGLPVGVAVAVAVTAEVGAKLGMAAMAALATASHEGFGSRLTRAATPRSLAVPVALSVLAVSIVVAGTARTVGASGLSTTTLSVLCGSMLGTALPWLWARRRLGGVSGDVFGAANEVSRVVGLHAGVIAWTLS